jgi:hypothetical protein
LKTFVDRILQLKALENYDKYVTSAAFSVTRILGTGVLRILCSNRETPGNGRHPQTATTGLQRLHQRLVRRHGCHQVMHIGYTAHTKVKQGESPMPVEETTGTLAPDVGTLVEYGLDGFGKEPARYRVEAWMRAAPTPEFTPHDFIAKILFESCREFDDKSGGRPKRMQFCLREEATHVSLAGICGAIAPVEQCEVVGNVSWPDGLLDDSRQRAVQLGLAHEMLF